MSSSTLTWHKRIIAEMTLRVRLLPKSHAFLSAALIFCALIISSSAAGQPLTKSAIQVDSGNTKTTGNTFGYRLTYTCGSNTGTCNGAEVVDLLPPEVQQVSTVPASPTGDVAAIQITPNFMGTGRTRVRFQLISSLPAGNSGDLIINVRFPNGTTPDGTAAVNTADGINLGTTPGTFTTPPVTVTAVATVQVNLSKTLTTSPANLDMPETYRLRISVPNNNGALNLTSIGPVVDTLPPGTVFNGATPAADCQPGCVGTSPATVTWTSPCSLPLQPNQSCDINLNGTFPSATFPSGTNVTNSFTADATPLGEPSQTFGPQSIMHPVTTFVPAPSASFTKNMASGTPNPPTLNQTFSYDLNISNNGNVPLDNIVVIDTLPVEMQVSSVTTGAYSGLSDYAAGEGVRISYEKNTALGVFTLWGSSPNTATNTTLNASPPGLGFGEYITRIRWEFGQAQPGMTSSTRPLITGRIINPDNVGGPVAFGDSIQNCADFSAVYTAGATAVIRNDCESFNLSGPFVQLNPAKDNLSGGGPFNPGQVVSWRLRVRSAAQSSDPVPLENLVVTDLLPVNLNFSSWTFDAQGTGLPAPQVFDQIPNYAGTGRTLLRWKWNAGSGNLGVNQQVWINISTTVRNGALAGSLSNDVTIDSDSPSLGLRCSNASQTDSLDLDGDGDTAEALCRATGTITVAGIAQLVASKAVKATCDGGYVSTSAGTLPGGLINYKIRVQNVATVPMQNFALIDILPFVGDTGVRDTSPRGSQFTPLLTGPIIPPPGTVIYYSTSGNPCRGEVGGPTSSCDPPNWSTVPPSPISAARSFKIEFGNRVIQPFDFLEFTFSMVTPSNITSGAQAFNSFAYQADRADGLGSLAAEPQKVGVSLGSCDAASIGDFVFADTNGDGVQNDGPTGVNNLTVRLFQPGADGLPGTLDDVLVGTTLTANGPDSLPGWYRFPGLAPGNYFVCATLPPNYSFTTPNVGADTSDSDANITGCSNVLVLDPNEDDPTVDFGLILAQTASIGNHVWFDLNNDGIQNESPNAGANGVTVRLYARNGSDTLIATTVTADDEFNRPGYYSFSGLTPGQQYFVEFVLPASATAFTTLNAGGDDAVDSDADTITGRTSVVTLTAGEFNHTLNAGLLKAMSTLSLGDQVWSETDNDGIFEPQNGETGIDGVLIWLYLDANNNSIPDADEYAGQTVTSTVSGFSGRYSFSNLTPGTYIVVIPSSNFADGALSGLTSATGNSPAPDPDGDVNGDDNGRTVGTALGSLPVTLTDNGEPTSEDGNNDSNLTLDFGFIPQAVNPTLAPTISKAFGTMFLEIPASTQLTFTITNPNGSELRNIGFNDQLPTGLVVATPNGLAGSCLTATGQVTNAASITAVAGSSNITVSSLALATGGSCTIIVNTTATTPGVKVNNTSNVIADEGVIGETATATLTVCSTIGLTNPSEQIVLQGGTATFSVVVSGNPTPSVQWEVSTDGGNTFNPIPNSTDPTLTLSNVIAAMNGYLYRVVATSACNTATSQAARLTVNTFEVEIGDPLVCLSPSGVVGVTATITNNNPGPVNADFTATLPAILNGLADSGQASLPGAVNVSTNMATWSGTIPGNTTVTITYQAQIVAGTPLNATIIIDSDVVFNDGPRNTVREERMLGCPAGPVNAALSDQKAGSVLVFPYYTSDINGNFNQSDTLFEITSVSNGPATLPNGTPNYQYLHLFFMNKDCSPADTFVCLTPNGTLQFKASEFDPLTTGYLIAVAVDEQGRPTQNNNFIGAAFVRDDVNGISDSYGAEAFWKYSPGSLTIDASGNSSLYFDGLDYDAVPIQLSTPLQDPTRAEQTLIIASLRGDLGTKLDSTSQAETGAIYRDDEALASFTNALSSGCLLQRAVTSQNFRLVPGSLAGFLKDRHGYMKFNLTTPAVGLVLSKQGVAGQPQNRFSGIRTLHKTQLTTSSLRLPVFPPFCQ